MAINPITGLQGGQWWNRGSSYKLGGFQPSQLGAPGASLGNTGTDPSQAAFTPINYQDLIQNNPYFKQARAMYGDPNDPNNVGSIGTSNLSDLSNAYRSAIIRFGQAPTGLSGPGAQFVTPDVANLAAQNQFSTVALEDRAHQQAARDTLNQLGARGLAGSSERPYLLGTTGGYGTAGGQVGFQFAQQRNQDIDNLNAYLAGAQRQYVDAENQRTQNYLRALYDATNQQTQWNQQVGAPNQNTPVVNPAAAAQSQYQPLAQPRARKAAQAGAARAMARLGRLF